MLPITPSLMATASRGGGFHDDHWRNSTKQIVTNAILNKRDGVDGFGQIQPYFFISHF